MLMFNAEDFWRLAKIGDEILERAEQGDVGQKLLTELRVEWEKAKSVQIKDIDIT